MSVEMRIRAETCSKCGLCAAICPALAIDHDQGQLPRRNPTRAKICMECSQCMAVCPSQSIVIGNLSYDRDFIDLSSESIPYSTFFNFASSRRSIRNFKDQPVPRELLEKIVEAITQAPMGFPPHKTAITIVQERSTIDQMMPWMLSFYEKMVSGFKNPIIRFLIKRDAGVENFATIQNHMLPILKLKVPDMKKGGKDAITHGAPALFLFHAKRSSENHTQDANIAMTYGLLAAHSLGLGATAIAVIPPAINRTPELKKMLRLPEDHEVVVSMIVGYPRYRYQRGIRRQLAQINWI